MIQWVGGVGRTPPARTRFQIRKAEGGKKKMGHRVGGFRGLLLQGPSQRDPQIPDSQFPSFYRVSEDPASRGPPQIPSLIPSVIPTYRVELEGLRT